LPDAKTRVILGLHAIYQNHRRVTWADEHQEHQPGARGPKMAQGLLPLRDLGGGNGGPTTSACDAIIAAMAETEQKQPGMVPDELKFEPKSKGLTTVRKKKPKELAVITECCTGCAGSPACVEYCPVEDCMFWVPDEDHPPFGRIQVDPILCIGCKKCISKGPDGCFLDGCPWDAIVMVDTTEVEKEVGVMPY